MAAGWKKILLEGDASDLALTSNEPEPVDGTAAAVGSGTDAAKDDHVHALGPLVAALDFAGQQATSLVLEAVDTAPDNGAETVGQIYFDTGDDRPMVWVASA